MKITELILGIFGIKVSSAYKYSENSPSIVFCRHPFFLIKKLRTQFLLTILISINIYLTITYTKWILTIIIVSLAVFSYVYWMYLSINLYAQYIKNRNTIYTWMSLKNIGDSTHIEHYIVHGIVVIIFISIDILLTFFLKFSWTNQAISLSFRINIIEIIIFIIIIGIIIYVIKLFLDFEVDKVIVSSWKIMFVDREWLYRTSNKVYLWSQIQTIEIMQSWRIDSFFSLWALQITVSSIGKQNVDAVLSFWKIRQQEDIEEKIYKILYPQ